jgi:3-hydroxyisobutyrate dehydrogenase-like beta-hydroxyacid dehydrogenase
MVKVALLGQGIMGSRIALNLLKAGFPLTIYNRTRAKAMPQLEKGAQWAQTPAAAASAAEVVISVVGDDAASRAVASPMVKGKAQRIIARDHTDTHFALRWLHKDMTHALRAADQAGVAMPTIAVARELVRLAMQAGLADQDCAAVAEVVRGKQI